MSQERNWLLVKRGLYERSDHMGYTGIRDHAGRYTEEEAKDSVRDGRYGVSMVRLEDAPEFTDACFDDLARKHLQDKIAAQAAEISALRGELESLRQPLPRDTSRFQRMSSSPAVKLDNVEPWQRKYYDFEFTPCGVALIDLPTTLTVAGSTA
ncbi:hypothetical protein [Mesorhizobium sp.]|uniref:hypothetical protein n=1 Tax=Mesorhizobium sp. TaxID=1871066 RepID=UPI000FEA391A|nr:hypothetical protein [Mesorhizobium sp.]RWO20712.1 MAG: hypothetical protein EOS09_26710 [Mesorhizobium sp.]